MIKCIEHTPSADGFNYITNSVGWETRETIVIKEALSNTSYSFPPKNTKDN